MLRNRLYYGIKPLLPHGMRMAIRRWFTLRKRERCRDIWPIMPGSERPPEGWPGWPNGKQFAMVLTHDVEGATGLNKVANLIEIEKKLGFRSAFNFIPEGEYTLTRELRERITRDGFEIGVHDLYHDGKLFLTKAEFSRNTAKINYYLKDWGAAGFRSGFMLHNLDWVHALNVQYDASTFDTDPFEPQPDHRNTIFPFWVSSPGTEANSKGAAPQPSGLASRGYVELPYTLPQDSTLFLLLGERHPDIWFQKLDWIAKRGGMALVNVHPDYMSFNGKTPARGTYPVECYTRFLTYARERYGDVFWQPLPKEVAAFIAQRPAQFPRRPRRVCMLTYSYFLSDARVKRYAETLADRGDQVDVLALRRASENPVSERMGNLNLLRIQQRAAKSEKSRLSFLLPILRFLFGSTFLIARRHLREPYDLLHIHNVPDFLVFAAWYPKLRGAKVILDIHDLVPEFYASKFESSDKSRAVKLLKWTERASAAFADHVIISNHLWRDKYAARTQSDAKCSVFINNVDARVFRPQPRTRNDGKFILLFPGGLQWHQGLDIVLRALPAIRAEVPSVEFHIYGDGNMKEPLISLAAELGLNDAVRFFDPLPVNLIVDVMANADVGVVPKRADSFGNEAYSTKIMEFMSVGVPVVVSSTRIDRYYFNDSVVRFFESGNPDALARAVLEVARSADLRQRLIANATQYANQNSWEHRKADYLRLVDSLIDGKPQGNPGANGGMPPEPAHSPEFKTKAPQLINS